MDDSGYFSDDVEAGPSASVAGDPDGLNTYDRYAIFLPAVQSLVNALGGYEELETSPGVYETVYRPGDSVLAVLKDLKKLWRKDDTDDERTVARCMARAGLMKELLALVVECTERGDWGRKVSLVACDLIAALTWPIDVQQELKEMEDEPDVVTDYASLLRSQVEYKAMILQTAEPLRCLLALMLPSLAKSKKDDRDARVISLGLHIVRNLLAIRDIAADGHAVGEKEEFSHLQSGLVVQLGQLTYFQLILTLASCADKADFNQYNVLVLDILHLAFRSVKPKELVQDQARAPLDKLTKLLETERRQRALNSRAGMTRHSRFGTTIAVKAGDQRLVLHKQNAIAVNAGKILDAGKKKRAERKKRVDDPSRLISYTPEAMSVLQGVAKTFIKSCFNTFFASILKDIRMERSKIRPADNTRTFALSHFFIDFLLLLRQKETDRHAQVNGNDKYTENDAHRQPIPHELPLGLVGEMAEMDSVRWVVMRMKWTMDDKPPAYTELQACLECFTQILLLIDTMALSSEEEDVEAAEILQNQIYYNGDVLDSSLQVITTYRDQSISYLDAIVNFAYVLLRMLEKYSKTKSYMFVRKRKAAKKKRKAVADAASTGVPEEYVGDDEAEGMDEDRDAPSYKEHAFQFAQFEQRFAQEAVVNTLLAYLTRFQEFDDPDQMKRVVGLMHRQVIKAQAEGLYFRVPCLMLFRRILDEQQSLPKADSSNDLLQVIKFVLRKFFKKVAEDPFVIVETLGPKSRGKWKELSSYKSDDKDDDGMGGQQSRIREKVGLISGIAVSVAESQIDKGPAELEFKKNKNLSWSDQMRVVVAMLLGAGREAWIRWVINELEIALAQKQEIVLTTDIQNDENSDSDDERRVRNFGGPSKEAIAKFTQYDLSSGDDTVKQGMARDPHFRLMLKLVSFERTEDEKPEEQRFFLPASILPANLQTSIGALESYLANPPTLEEDPRILLRNARKRRRRPSISGSEDEDGVARPKKQRKRKEKETQIYKSAAFIMDSDDDEAADEAFFARERQLREEMEELARKHGGTMMATGKKKRKKGKGKQVDIQSQEPIDQSQSPLRSPASPDASSSGDESDLEDDNVSMATPSPMDNGSSTRAPRLSEDPDEMDADTEEE